MTCIMQTIAIDNSIARCVTLSDTRLCCEKKTVQIEVLFGVTNFGGPRHIVYMWVLSLLRQGEKNWGGGIAR